MRLVITPELLIAAYRQGAFPMGRGRDDPDLVWLSPLRRGVLPLDRLHVGRSLRKVLRKAPFAVTVDRDFAGVVDACAAPAPDREDTWITPQIADLYVQLHARGFAHSVECWIDGGLAGGLYGVSIGAAFFGESMFSRHTEASKVALVHLVARLRAGGFALLDTQFTTEHLRGMGAVEIARPAYLKALNLAIDQPASFTPPDAAIEAEIAKLIG
jgi:leucyl/phenylalanyl-tRNA---protein transferase